MVAEEVAAEARWAKLGSSAAWRSLSAHFERPLAACSLARGASI